jgi:regulator of protease activity HflC (stomatin/prohibitin superfamily)/membrane protein implicated in regulation of membrane protease activity
VYWWGWIVVGALLLSAELFVPTDFFLVFLGVAALLVGGVGLVGFALPVWGQWLLFAALSLLLLVTVRGHIKRRMPAGDSRADDTLVGEVALIREHLEAGATGTAELRGARWTARNADATALEPAPGCGSSASRDSCCTCGARASGQTRRRSRMESVIAAVVVVILVIILIARTAIVVPQQSAYVIENLGKYSRTISAGFHILIPFVEKVAYRHSLKERAIDIAEQICITKDNVQVGVDGVLYLKVLDPQRTSYGISDYLFAITQLAQTTLRSEVGKIDLDRSFEERGAINVAVVTELDKASEPWGVKVLRYEIKNINPPTDVLQAMEKQMRAEREKRAIILASEGERDAKINQAEGQKQRVIKESEASKQQQINEAEGEAEAILAVATATAESLRRIAVALREEGGSQAMELRIAERYLEQFGHLAQAGNTIVLPATISDVGSMIALARGMLRSDGAAPGATRP